ncbi:dTDP-4-dehydrorhamnose 3,5-epimerase [Aeromonas cavernicola]|uniref:dTDP-4-dehydrorhamnose 3,5-epimerase n=1 Tax=Aeromonas cavernicola TaxID=1006623 RepID=A0A2H9U829_9GAMM|nr:dTDP-4-dehydrorhamnose 3,5-epimerase [Aeromonas cavernicola]PJG60158.1 dTDP-4-dehydrorhamnose 3,5-epimerase [Aeromonas cavernicola]
MQYKSLALPDVILITPHIHRDVRGSFQECFRESEFKIYCGHYHFVQDNISRSKKGTLRGLHYQKNKPQGKLIQVITGRIFDVAVDMRPNSITYGQTVGYILDADQGELLWIPPGFAHGFYVMSDHADIHYKCTDYYSAEDECAIHWNSPKLNIAWPLLKEQRLYLSERDLIAPNFS